ncbi:hypothetical protein WJX82_010159 [Trebouxia sp. C0006]
MAFPSLLWDQGFHNHPRLPTSILHTPSPIPPNSSCWTATHLFFSFPLKNTIICSPTVRTGLPAAIWCAVGLKKVPTQADVKLGLTMMLQQARQWFNQLFSHRGAWTRVPTQEVPIALGDPLIPPSASPPSQHTAGNHRPGDGPSPRTAAAAAAQARQAKFEASQKKTAGPS